jgi:uncharacterized protein (DUF1501 family)
MKRRTALKILGLSALTPKLIRTSLAAEVYDNKFMVVLNLPGGWDTTLGLDPWTGSKRPASGDLFLEYKNSEIMRSGNIHLGPAAKSMSSYASNMAIINGIFMSETDSGHDAAEKYMLTGGTGHKSSMVLSLADAMNNSTGLGVLTNYSLIRAKAKTSSSAIDGVRNAFSNKLTGKELGFFSQNQTHSTLLTKAINQMVNNSPNMTNLFKSLENAGYDQETNDLNAALIVASAFQTNSSQFAELRIETGGNGFDTHSSHEGTHLRAQKEAFDSVKNILDLFKNTPYGDSGESLYDRTTFMVTSEFSRTAALNNAGGKDHNPMTNSVMLIGNGIKGNQVVGASRLVTRNDSNIGLPYQIGMPYDFNSSEVITQRREGSEFINPENILRTLCDVMDIDASKVEGVDPNTPVLKSIIS